jgi:hypothetical protein
MQTMSALSSPQIRHAEFVRLTLPSATYTFCNAAQAITVSGITFSGLGSFLQLSDVQRDIKSTSDDISVSLTGIDPSKIAIILGSEIKGSLLEIWRGFLDSNNQIITSPSLQFFKRYKGIVSSASINEKFDEQVRERVATCLVSAASIRRILENRMAGIKTNPSSWQRFYPNDTSMNRVPVIANTFFDFGKEPQTGSVSNSGYNSTGAGANEGQGKGWGGN